MGYYTSITFEERFFMKVNKDSGQFPDPTDPLVSRAVLGTECWIWTGAYNSNGYPRYNCKVPGYRTNPYRISWMILRGPIRNSLDHLCRNPGCVNPDHLEDVTDRVNVLRSNNPCARNARKTHCINGHEFTGENTLNQKDGRRCRTCANIRGSAWHKANRRRKREEKENKYGNHQHS